MEITKVKDFVIRKGTDAVHTAELTPVVKSLVTLIGTFLLMNPFVAGKLSPFAVSLTAASSATNAFWSGAGGIIGAFFFFDDTDSIKYCACLLFCILVRNIYERYLPEEAHLTAMGINSFSSVFLVGNAINIATGFSLEAFFSVLFESLLCYVGAMLFTSSAKLIWGDKEVSRFSTTETVTVLLTVNIMLMPFYKYKLLAFSPITTVFAFLILLFARLRGSSGGALCGICAGTVSGLSSEVGFVSVGYALSGLLSGEFSRKGKAWCVGGYIVPLTVCAFADGTLNSYMAIFEGVVACAVFASIPDRLYDELSEKVNVPFTTRTVSENSRLLTRKIHEASDAIAEVSDCIVKVQNTLNPLTQTRLNEVLKNTWHKVCSECELRESCQKELKNPGPEDIDRIAAALTNRAPLDETRFPKGFYSACYCFSEMRSALNNRYLSFTASLGVQGKIDQMQSIVCDQFRSMAGILNTLAEDLDDGTQVNSDIAELCANEAKEVGLNVIDSGCTLDKFGRVTLKLCVSPPRADFNITQFTHNLSNITGTRLNPPDIQEDGESHTLSFTQKIEFSISVGVASRTADEENICGDYYRTFRDSDDRYIVILSDGMGTGNRAAIDSAMATELFSTLIRSGLSFSGAVSIVNSALLIKSSDESLATLDVVCIDLYTGKTDFMKAGAATTFIRHKDSVAQYEQASLPLGILRDIDFPCATANLAKGDIVLVVSDGIQGDCNNWIQYELRSWDTSRPPEELAKFILNSSCERKIGKRLDDMTAIVVYIQ
jgi:stage II sporulation protein E